MTRGEKIRKLWTSPLTNFEIAARVGVSAPWLGRLAKSLGLPKRKSGPKACHMPGGYRHQPSAPAATADPVARAWRCAGCNGPSNTPAGHPSCQVGRAA